MLEGLLDLCNDVSYILSQASIIESYIFKPGNASRSQDLVNVKYIDIVKSALISSTYYKELCIRGFRGISRIYDTLVELVTRSNKFGFEYQLFGTYLLIAPFAYEAAKINNVFELRKKAAKLLRSLGALETRWFLDALKELNLKYLGKLSSMDYREIENIDFFTLMEFSSKYDIVALNMVNDYSITFAAYKVIKEGLCGLERDVQRAFLYILSNYPDTLIYKKYGAHAALEASKVARLVFSGDCPSSNELEWLNKYLINNNFNPGSTADLIASALAIYYLDEWYGKKGNPHSGFSV
ncbi:CitG family protein [Saccharolobus solfataricus]|nr:triphosphoribosyl-dephospho-CoA synthase [Saccharolobus solfataricus]AKA73537.1 CitG family protein [Saccharolobus solfataricus]AKA76235.1 CitG family protein [Saccharolobus solfataricus]AKA78927.1 CitG family protein [Saccharolobus solfataricus]AZF68006.1 CitG family protein [Saccharolobus solfataricus]AZF70626.1 CitG family protein [Saccharolobus solfataricus]